MSESKWKQIVGKAISEGAYVSPDSLKKDYTRAMDETCFRKRIAEDDIEKLAKKKALEAFAESMGIPKSMIKISFRKARNIEDEIELLEKMIKEERAQSEDPNDCPNGDHCSERFEEVNESNLLQYLRQGWQIVHRCEDGRVIVKR